MCPEQCLLGAPPLSGGDEDDTCTPVREGRWPSRYYSSYTCERRHSVLLGQGLLSPLSSTLDVLQALVTSARAPLGCWVAPLKGRAQHPVCSPTWPKAVGWSWLLNAPLPAELPLPGWARVSPSLYSTACGTLRGAWNGFVNTNLFTQVSAAHEAKPSAIARTAQHCFLGALHTLTA